MSIQVFHTLEAGTVFVQSLGGTGYALSSLHNSDNPVNAVFVPGTRAYALALAVVEGARGSQEPAPTWFAAGFKSAVEALSAEAAFQAVDPAVWEKYLTYASEEFDNPTYEGPEPYDTFLKANGLPVFRGAADSYVESLGETFLGS
jgi:hypothetical protein